MAEDLIHNERNLLLQVAEGNQFAFKQLFDKYRNRIYSLGMHLTRSEILSEEIVQDVFMKVWEKREQLGQIDYFNAWLRTVAKNTCSNYLRSLAIETLTMKRYTVNAESKTASPENDIESKEFGQIIDAAIHRLPPQQKKVYLLSRQSGKKQEEIARELGISIYTVKEYLKLAQRSIRQYLEGNIDLAVIVAIGIHLH